MIGFLIWLLLFAVSTAALAIAIRCAWSLRKSLYATAAFKEKLIPLLKQGDWQGAFDYCEAHSTLAAKIINEVLLIAHEKGGKERQELVSEMLDRRVHSASDIGVPNESAWSCKSSHNAEHRNGAAAC